ncbi:MAG: hypothetical protein SPL94_07770, partial [Oribacterium sp.]|nr:hypothetical protein [Oribacterium sp.]
SVIFDTGFDTDYSRDNKVASLPQAWVVLTMPFPTISLRCPQKLSYHQNGMIYDRINDMIILIGAAWQRKNIFRVMTR